MRILQICSAEGAGGGEIHVADLTLGLIERGIHVEVATRSATRLPELIERLAKGDVPEIIWHELPFRNALDLTSMRGLARIVMAHSIDVVHAHVARDYPVSALAVVSGRRAELALTRHHYLPIKGNVLYRRLLAKTIIIAVSESVRETVLSNLGIDPDRVVTIPNWIDLSRHEVERDRGAERRRLEISRRVAVALIGQITPLKGHETFVRAAARVLEQRSDVEFLIVGEDSDPGQPFERRVRRLVERLGIGDRVRLVGYQPDLIGVLAAVDTVAVPSWNEAFSLVTAEAMAAGRPVIASRVGALTELIEDDVTGLLVPPRDVGALADAILRLAADPALEEHIGHAAKQSAQRFNRKPRIDAIVEVYERLVRERAVARRR